MIDSNFQLDQAVEILSRTPGVLRQLLSGISDDWVVADEGSDSWSTFDILGHLVNGEKTDWIVRVRTIIEHGTDRGFEPFDRFSQFEESRGKTASVLLDEFEELRSRTVDELKGLVSTRAQLDLTGIHPDFGEVSLSQLLAAWVVHDLGHIAQISRVMAKRYTNDVGPWVEYLPVLTDRS
ncbi:MAG: DinB family protein [Rhodothermales bacterium]|nr:DinB family protein [Rhodothermales bacterium]